MRRVCCIAQNFRYNVNGFVEELTQLPENRLGHSCAAIPSTGVRLILFQSYQFLNPLQEYIVAGGGGPREEAQHRASARASASSGNNIFLQRVQKLI